MPVTNYCRCCFNRVPAIYTQYDLCYGQMLAQRLFCWSTPQSHSTKLNQWISTVIHCVGAWRLSLPRNVGRGCLICRLLQEQMWAIHLLEHDPLRLISMEAGMGSDREIGLFSSMTCRTLASLDPVVKRSLCKHAQQLQCSNMFMGKFILLQRRSYFHSSVHLFNVVLTKLILENWENSDIRSLMGQETQAVISDKMEKPTG